MLNKENKTGFKFTNANSAYKQIYMQFPIALLYNTKYSKLSDSAKLAYIVLHDRFRYSLANNWVDDNNNVYFIFTNEELQKLLNCGKDKIIKIKKELVNLNLLHQERQGLNQPNRLYLAELEVDSHEAYLPEKTSSILDTKGTLKNRHNLYNNNLDTNRHLKDTETDDLQNQLLLDGFVDLMNDSSISTFVPDRCLNLIAKFSETFEQAQLTVKTIHNAKYKSEQETGKKIVYEVAQENWDVDTKLYTTLLKAYQKQKTENGNNLQNLIFIYVKNLFVEHVSPSLKQNKKDLPSVSINNWL